jgi:dihydrodipicolinate synthase/N-acetylneuraminate lyase
MADYPQPPAWVPAALREGIVIPAHPLALTPERRLDERHQRALTRYYHAAGAGGLALGVHTTQFAIRNPEHGLLEPVLQLAVDTLATCDALAQRQTVRIAGICGPTRQAVQEAELARRLGYHAGLLSLGALREASDDALIAHCEAVARSIPLFGFYLQPAAGGRLLSHQFWRRFAEIPNAIGIKIAPFNRYQTVDVLRAVAESARASELALYTGNDDNILMDLVTDYAGSAAVGERRVRIVGGLLGHWACWTQRAVEVLKQCQQARNRGSVPSHLLALALQITDSNAALFDARNHFSGCIPGIHVILQRQGLLRNAHCLDPRDCLSPGQRDEIDRVCAAYPHLNDNDFVAAHLDEWLA